MRKLFHKITLLVAFLSQQRVFHLVECDDDAFYDHGLDIITQSSKNCLQFLFVLYIPLFISLYICINKI